MPHRPLSVKKRRAAVLLLAAVAIAGGAAWAWSTRTPPWRGPPPGIGLFTTLPILWREGESVADMLHADTQPDSPPHWALQVLKKRGRLYPLDSLSPMPQRLTTLVMAQPRPLSPKENVALDDWVQGGGRLLLFADPLLTQESEFAIGDRRRPQDIVLLSPILNRWGLALEFDDAQPAGEETVRLPQGRTIVNLPGRLVPTLGGASAENPCVIALGGISADCRIGAGRVLVFADAALLEAPGGEGDNLRAGMLAGLLALVEGEKL